MMIRKLLLLLLHYLQLSLRDLVTVAYHGKTQAHTALASKYLNSDTGRQHHHRSSYSKSNESARSDYMD